MGKYLLGILMDYAEIQEQIIWLLLKHTRIEIEKIYEMITADNQIIKTNIKQLESAGYLEVVLYTLSEGDVLLTPKTTSFPFGLNSGS